MSGEKSIKRTISLDKPLAEAILAYASLNGLDFSSACRSLCTTGLDLIQKQAAGRSEDHLSKQDILKAIQEPFSDIDRRLDDIEGALDNIIALQED